MTYYSHRELPLVYIGPSQKVPVLTIENYLKWYSLFLVMPDESVVEVTEYTLKDFNETCWYDHLPNPNFVLELAKRNEYFLDSVSMDLIVGRYARQIREEFRSK